MFKFFSRKNIVRDEEVFDGNAVYDSIEFYTTNDTKTGKDIGRPVENIYRNWYETISTMETLVSKDITQPSVLENSISQNYILNDTDDIVQVILDGVANNYVRIPPGIAVIPHTNPNSEEHQRPLFLVSTPDTTTVERQITKILEMDVLSGRETVDIKYNYGTDSFKGKIIRKVINSNVYTTNYYGCVDEGEFENDSLAGLNTGVELLTAIYNTVAFIEYFRTSLSGDLTLLPIEPFQKITAVTDYYASYNTDTGKIEISNIKPTNFFDLSTITITDIGVGTLAGTSVDTRVLYEEKNSLSATSVDVDAILLDAPNGGIVVNVADGKILKVNGDMTVDGTFTTVGSEDLIVSDNMITLNDGETGAGVTLGTSGIQVDRGPATDDYQFVVDDTNPALPVMKSGTVGALKILPNIQDSPADGKGFIWNATTQQLESDTSVGGGFTTVEEFDFDTQTDFDWSVRDIGENPITSTEEAINTNRQDMYEFIELLSTEGANYQVAAGAALLGVSALPGITPSGKTSGMVANLQAMLNGMINPNVVTYQYKENTAVDGDLFAADTWNIVGLNTTVREEILNATLTSNEITLSSGVYDVEAFSVGNVVGKQKLRLYNSTGNSTLLTGLASGSNTANEVSTAVLSGQITVSGTIQITLDHYTELAGSNGLSVDDGSDEIYSQINITQRG